MRFYKLSLVVCLLFVPSLINAADYASGVQAKVHLKTTTTVNGSPVTYLKTNKPEITVMNVEFAPGAQTGWHKHPEPVYAYVISGSLTVNIEGNITRQFNAGDVIIEVVNTRHNGINKGDVPVKLIVFYTGEKDKPIIVKTAAP